MKKLLSGLILLTLAGILLIGCGGGGGNNVSDTVEVNETISVPDETISVPINIQDAPNLGSLQVELLYDSNLLTATAVKSDTMASNAMIESNLGSKGRVIIGVVDAAGINGQGPLVDVTFKVIGKSGSCPITLQKITAHEAANLTDIQFKTTDGSVTLGNKAVVSPVVSFIR